LFGKFHGVGHEIDHDLHDTVTIRIDDTFGLSLHEFDFNRIWSCVFHFHLLTKIFHQLIDIRVGIGEVEGPGFYFSHIDNIVYQLQQQFVVRSDDMDKFLFLLRIVCFD